MPLFPRKSKKAFKPEEFAPQPQSLAAAYAVHKAHGGTIGGGLTGPFTSFSEPKKYDMDKEDLFDGDIDEQNLIEPQYDPETEQDHEKLPEFKKFTVFKLRR